MSFRVNAGALPGGTRVLLTGVGGQVGHELQRSLAALGEVVAPSRTDLDLSDAGSVRDAVRRLQPRWIVNAAAYTAVDRAESEPEQAYAVNAGAVQVMAEEARSIGAGLLHFSTDYVFDGNKAAPYTEEDATCPVNVYGKSKLAGERALEASGAAYAILRTSWVYGAAGKNFLLTILRMAREKKEIKIVADQHGAPTWSRELAALAAHLIVRTEERARGGDLADAMGELGGLYHTSGSGYTTWYGFACEAVALSRAREPSVRFADIEPIATAEFPTVAKRPANSRLNCTRLEDRLGWTMMDWRISLAEVMTEL